MRRRTTFSGFVALTNVLVNLVLNYLLIKYYHAFGAALATCSFYVYFYGRYPLLFKQDKAPSLETRISRDKKYNF